MNFGSIFRDGFTCSSLDMGGDFTQSKEYDEIAIEKWFIIIAIDGSSVLYFNVQIYSGIFHYAFFPL